LLETTAPPPGEPVRDRILLPPHTNPQFTKSTAATETETTMQEKQNYKLQGELVELRFLARAAELGLRVSKPYGDSAPYDVLVESGGAVYKVQVKSTGYQHPSSRSYRCTTHPSRELYSSKEVDFIAAYIISEEAWYIIPLRAISARQVYLNPRFRRNKYRRYREAWDLLIPERHNRRWFRKPKHATG
jgi:hypothetical protein